MQIILMVPESQNGSYGWMLTHAVAVENIILRGDAKIPFVRHDPIMTDVMLMILCRAFLLPKQVELQPQDLE